MQLYPYLTYFEMIEAKMENGQKIKILVVLLIIIKLTMVPVPPVPTFYLMIA